VQFVIPLASTREPLFRRIYAGLRTAILSGTLPAKARLPSTRELAAQLGVSRTVAVLAYEHLLAEGFVTGRGGSGTYVAGGLSRFHTVRSGQATALRLSRFGSSAAEAASRVSVRSRQRQLLPYDFAYAGSDIDAFPWPVWNRILLRCARRVPISELDYGQAAGNAALREAICAHLRRSRAVQCDPSRIIIVNGSQQALDLVTRVLVDRGDAVAIEDPAYQGTSEVLRAAGARLLPVAIDRYGLDTARLPAAARMVFVTPSHQFPTGATLPLERRLALLEWARLRNVVVLEDDYDGEFRYDGQPLESLQGLDRDSRVIYVGTFSRTVFSSLRIGYLVAPSALVPALTTAKWLCDRHTSRLEQQTLAEFIASGAYGRHLRRTQRANAARRKVLLDAIGKYLRGRVEITGDGAGAHVVLWPHHRASEESVMGRAKSMGVGVYGLSAYYLQRAPRPGFLLGYSRLTEAQIHEGIRRLGKLL
jgi:GntR family transcriptional regulator / MocR family aminotransferase